MTELSPIVNQTEPIIDPDEEKKNFEDLRKSLNIHQKILKVMNEVQYINTDMKIQYKTTNYKALSNEKVVSVIREKLVKWGLTIVQTDSETIKQGNITSMKCYYLLSNADNPSENIQLVHHGDGADSQDKGPGKASTYAYKYMLIRTFALPFGNDPDKISSDELTDKTNERMMNIMKDTEGLIRNFCTAYNVSYQQAIEQIVNQSNIPMRTLNDLNEQQLIYINKMLSSFRNI